MPSAGRLLTPPSRPRCSLTTALALAALLAATLAPGRLEARPATERIERVAATVWKRRAEATAKTAGRPGAPIVPLSLHNSKPPSRLPGPPGSSLAISVFRLKP